MNEIDRVIIEKAKSINFWIRAYRESNDLNQQDADRIFGLADTIVNLALSRSEDVYELTENGIDYLSLTCQAIREFNK